MRYLYLSLLLLLSAAVFGQTETTDSVFTEVEQMPLFRADCNKAKKQKVCADRAMMEYISTNLRYPTEARNEKAEGMAVVSFIVETDGTLSSPAILRNPGYGMGEEVLRLVRAMNADGVSWTPGIQDGKPVRVEFKLPVKFKYG